MCKAEDFYFENGTIAIKDGVPYVCTDTVTWTEVPAGAASQIARHAKPQPATGWNVALAILLAVIGAVAIFVGIRLWVTKATRQR
jgi:hypothetical protein